MTIEIVKEILGKCLETYDVEERSFPEGDLGALLQIEFNNSSKGGNIDLWSSGWFGVFVWDYVNERALLNVLVDLPLSMSSEEVVMRRFTRPIYYG